MEHQDVVDDIPMGPIVTSGESDEGVMDDEDHDDGHDAMRVVCESTADDLFDEGADEADEAYVNKHLRSVVGEVSKEESSSSSTVPKPPSSDAILSCPCCFVTVCMDCQRHERFTNQYRALFVMNIMVRWDQMLKYDKKQRCLVAFSPPKTTMEKPLVPSHDDPIYYTVCCAHCQTQVASLDMADEVYHFFGCLASNT